MATVRHTVPDTTDAFELFFFLAFLFTLDPREELGWSLAGLVGVFNGWKDTGGTYLAFGDFSGW